MLSAILKPHSDEEVWCFPRFYLPHAEPPKQQLVCPPDTHTITNQSLCVLFLTDAFFLSVTRTMSLFLPPLPDNRLKSSISHVLPRHLSRIPSSSNVNLQRLGFRWSLSSIRPCLFVCTSQNKSTHYIVGVMGRLVDGDHSGVPFHFSSS